MTDSNELHLSQISLENIKEIDEILQNLGKWLQRAKFEDGKKEGTQNCADRGMPAAAAKLLDALGLKRRKKYNVMRIRGPNTTRIGSKADIVHIQAWGFDPMLDGKELKPKTVTHITKRVEVKVEEGSIADLLIIADTEEN